jgi:hypothetical protein
MQNGNLEVLEYTDKISLDAYKKSCDNYIKELKSKIDAWKNELRAF